MKFFCTTLLTLLFSFLVNTQIVIAGQVDKSIQLDSDSLENLETVNDNEKSLKINSNERDIFGDEQTFPFVAGLGKNAAH